VAFRLSRTWGVPVRAEFTCPDSRTITMRITEGEGARSVVETHTTPLGNGPDGQPRTMVTEATIAYSDRPGFRSHAGSRQYYGRDPAYRSEALGGRPRLRRAPL
jgi:hypothetical protein